MERRETDYYTQAVLESSVKITQPRQQDHRVVPGGEWGQGDGDVTWQTVAFKKIKFGARENIGLGPVDIPAQTLQTVGLWLAPGPAFRDALKQQGLRLTGERFIHRH